MQIEITGITLRVRRAGAVGFRENEEVVDFDNDHPERHPHPSVSPERVSPRLNIQRDVLFGTGMNYYVRNFDGKLPLTMELVIGDRHCIVSDLNTEDALRVYTKFVQEGEFPPGFKVLTVSVVAVHPPADPKDSVN